MGYWDLVKELDFGSAPGQVVGALSGEAAMAGIVGQYFFLFMMEGSSNFLHGGQIHSFTMEEKMGGDVPIFEFSFSTLDKTLKNRLHAGTKISCRFGRSMLESKTAELRIQGFKVNEGEHTAYMDVTISGFVENSEAYLREEKQVCYPGKTSKEAIIGTAEDHFNVVDLTTSETDDKKNWIRPNESALKFIYKTWTNSFISDDNFLMIAVNFHRDFLITDLKSVLLKEPKWVLSPGYMGGLTNHSSYNPAVEMSSAFGLMNQLAIYKKTTPTHSINDEKQSKVETSPPKNQYSTGALNIKDDIQTKSNTQEIIDDTLVHKNELKAPLNNMSKQTLQNSVELNIIIENKWQDYELFDLIMYNPSTDYVTGVPNSGDNTRGIYCITRISRFYAKQRACTLITISRDGMSNLEGSGLGTWTSSSGSLWGIPAIIGGFEDTLTSIFD